MSTSTPETNPSSAPESKPKQFAEPIYTYVVSWTWLLAGLIGFLGFCGIAGAMYFVQNQGMANKILTVVDDMIKRSDLIKAERERTNDPAVKRDLMSDSLKLRNDAANLLNNYKQANPETTNLELLTRLYDILESLYQDYGEGTTALGLQRGEQLSGLAVELSRNVSNADSIKYFTRLLELEWDRRSFSDIIRRGKELLAASQRAGNPEENYDGMRYIAMALFDYLAVESYNPTAHELPSAVFPDTMDELLVKLYARKPEDIEIVKRYAEFMVSLDHPEEDRQRRFRDSASEQLRNRTPAVRLADAKRIIDSMVERNGKKPAAYLTRYHFLAFYSPDSRVTDQVNTDLLKVLELDPSHSEALILCSLDALRQAETAARSGDEGRASTWQNDAETYLRRAIAENPSDYMGYQYLGDYFLFVKGEPNQAVAVWNNGLKDADRRGTEELIGRLVIVLLDQKKIDEVREKLETLSRTLSDIRLSRPGDFRRTDEMQRLLTARLANVEADIAGSKVEAARRENRSEEVRRLLNVVQSKKGEAVQMFEQVLQNWGRDSRDFVFLNEKRSVYSTLLPESLLHLGDLKLDWNEPDSAAIYFTRATQIPSPSIQREAFLKLSVAQQQSGRLDDAARAMKAVSDLSPQNLSIRYAYTTLLFRSQVQSNTANTDSLNAIERELNILRENRDELAQPWALDIRLIHLGVARANLSNNADTILESINEATRRFRVLERQTFPPDKEGTVRNYIDDPAFVTELVGIYSSLSARDDFDRLLERLRAFPGGGEDAYYEARINDALRRDDREGAIAIIDEASTNTLVSSVRRERFVSLLQSLRTENVDGTSTLDKVYNQLTTTFDEAPESLKPQAFFLLANMSLDRDNPEQAKLIEDRLRKLEGSGGTMWRYIAVRIMLAEKDPDYVQMRDLQEQIAGFRPNWDMAYILRTLIEEQYLMANPDSPDILNTLIQNYRSATDCGNTRPAIWQRLVALLEIVGRPDEAREAVRIAALRGVMLETQTGQLPQPYGRMFSQVQEALHAEDATGADMIAQQCIALAERRGENPNLVFLLNLTLGRVFLDSRMFDSARRHLEETAKRRGTNVFPLALCEARAGDVDGGFTRILDEIDAVPSAMPSLLSSIILLLAQMKPSEAVFERIDNLMGRIERGERLTLRSTLEASDEDSIFSIGTRRVESRIIQSFVLRFPDRTDNVDPSMIQFFAPEDFEEDEETVE